LHTNVTEINKWFYLYVMDIIKFESRYKNILKDYSQDINWDDD